MALEFFRYFGEAVALLTLVLLYLVAAWSYPLLPDRVPRHFNLRGEPDAWAAQDQIWLLPVAAFLLYVLVTLPLLLGWSPPSLSPLGLTFLALLKGEWLLCFLWIEWRTVEVAHGRAQGLGVAFLPVWLLVTCATLLGLTVWGTR
jgi:hypothetical protein